METPTTIKAIPFEEGHLKLLELRDDEHNGAFNLEDIEERVRTFVAASMQVGTFVSRGRVVCIAGFHCLWPGVLEGWIFPSRFLFDCPVLYARVIKRYVDSISKGFNCHRFQAYAVDNPTQERWMRFLGFEKEGTLRQFGHDKQDFCMYARVM